MCSSSLVVRLSDIRGAEEEFMASCPLINNLAFPGMPRPNNYLNTKEFYELMESNPKRAFAKMTETMCAVHKAVVYGGSSKLKAALASGADKDEQDHKGRTGLHCACGYAKIKLAKRLLKAGANVNAVDYCNNTPLHFAVYCGSVECVTLLLKKGAAVTMRNINNKTPIDLAKDANQLELLKLFA